MPTEPADVVVVGGGPAGATTAIRLAGAGWHVVVLERSAAWRWRAGGVFSSPATMRELRDLGIDEAVLASVAQPVPAMRVETPTGTTFRLTYGAERPGGCPAVGLDRERLDAMLLACASAAGAEVRRGTTATGVRRDATGAMWVVDTRSEQGDDAVAARVVIGAEGLRSIVARSMHVDRRPRLDGRIGLTFHVADLPGDPVRDARMVLLGDAYCGIAPVPRGRVNVGIVLIGARWRRELARGGAAHVVSEILRLVPVRPDAEEPWRGSAVLDAIEGAYPLGARVARRAGDGWLLVGDAAGFLDPFTGEGLHRGLVSARLAAAATDAHLRQPRRASLRHYDTVMRRRFAGKDLVSLVVQQFVSRPALFEYAARRLATRHDVRATMGLVMGDLVPASRALDPRFVARLLAP